MIMLRNLSVVSRIAEVRRVGSGNRSAVLVERINVRNARIHCRLYVCMFVCMLIVCMYERMHVQYVCMYVFMYVCSGCIVDVCMHVQYVCYMYV